MIEIIEVGVEIKEMTGGTVIGTGTGIEVVIGAENVSETKNEKGKEI